MRLVERQIVLAGAALLAVVVALAAVELTRRDGAGAPAEELRGTGGGEWYTALAAPYAFAEGAEQTACGQKADRTLKGVAHPVLPCGAKITIEYKGTTVLTQVVDRGAASPGREFDVTRALALDLELQGIRQIRWRFAQ